MPLKQKGHVHKAAQTYLDLYKKIYIVSIHT